MDVITRECDGMMGCALIPHHAVVGGLVNASCKSRKRHRYHNHNHTSIQRDHYRSDGFIDKYANGIMPGSRTLELLQ